MMSFVIYSIPFVLSVLLLTLYICGFSALLLRHKDAKREKAVLVLAVGAVCSFSLSFIGAFFTGLRSAVNGHGGGNPWVLCLLALLVVTVFLVLSIWKKDKVTTALSVAVTVLLLANCIVWGIADLRPSQPPSNPGFSDTAASICYGNIQPLEKCELRYADGESPDTRYVVGLSVRSSAAVADTYSLAVPSCAPDGRRLFFVSAL